jgi:hypothetical protein
MVTSCQQRTVQVSDPTGWEVISRELVYRRPDGETVTEYIDSNQWVYTTKSPAKIRVLRQTRHTYTAQVTWMDAQGKWHADPEINIWHSGVPQQLLDRQKRALIGQRIDSLLIAEILKLPTRNARASYGFYCSRNVLIVKHDDVLSYYDMKTGIEIARYRQGVADMVLQTGRWMLRKGMKRGVYKIVCQQ